ncbi:MAG: hypothetical protein KGI27_00720 [Thaumarchaeota archaeon]|nr:hypothetical protein [Nitrososphaerota archaeon]
MKILHISIVVISLVAIFFGMQYVYAQNVMGGGPAVAITLDSPEQVKSDMVSRNHVDHPLLIHSTNINDTVYPLGPDFGLSSPLKQFKSGIKPSDITCQVGLQPIIKAEDGSPACVKPDTVQILIKRGWATSTADLKPWVKIDIPSLNDTYVVNQPISFSVTVKGFGNYPCVSPQIKIHDDKNPNVPVFQDNGSTMSCPSLRTDDNYSFDFPGNNSQYVIILNKTGDYTMTISYGDNSVQKYFSIVLPSNQASMTILENNAGVVLLKNQAYYFETPNYTNDAYAHPVQVSFHDVLFTLFPTGFRGGLPARCGVQYYWADAKFPDDTSESLHIFAGPDCPVPPLPDSFSKHANPQAGLTYYAGKMKLLVSTGSQNDSSTERIRIIPEYPITTGINKNGTITQSETIEILFDNFKQNLPLVIQISNPHGGIYKVDTIPPSDIQSDGFYKYQIYIKGNESDMGKYNVVITHGNATASTSAYLSDAVP